MKVKCKVCRRDIEINEAEYNPGDKVTVECERCGNEVEVTIPEREEEKPEAKEPEVKAVPPVPQGGQPKPAQQQTQTSATQTTTASQATQQPARTQQPAATQRSTSTQQAGRPTGGYQRSTQQVVIGQHDQGGKKTQWIVIGVLLALVCVATGWWYYANIYLPEKIDREAPRTYPIVNINLRSSKMAGSDYNKLTSVPYGGELITYEQDGEWAEVKYVKPDGSESTKGYAASPYLLDKKDFFLLNSIFGDNDAREILATSKVRRALLDYYKEHGYVGSLSQDMMNEVGLTAGPDSQWQVFFPRGEQKPNEVVFKRLVNPNSKYTDMALLIKNINNGERKLLYFYFDDDETPHFLGEMDAPSDGTLKDIVNNNGNFTPIYSY